MSSDSETDLGDVEHAQAAVVDHAGDDFRITEVAFEPPGAGQVMVRIDAVGMCHADLAARYGDFPVPYPIVLGHEGTGVVERVGPGVTTHRPGDRVVLSFDSCGVCAACVAGCPSRCEQFLELDFTGSIDREVAMRDVGGGLVHHRFFGQSSFAERAIATVRNAVRVETDLPAEVLAPLGCGVQTGFGAVETVLRPRHGDDLAVSGLGAVGLSAILAARLHDPRTLIALDPDPVRRALAMELGATAAVDPVAVDAVEAVRDLTGGGVHGAVEASGNIAALSAAVAFCRTGGTTVAVGAPPFGTTAALDVADLVNGSKRLIGSVEGDSVPWEVIPRLVRLVEDGSLPVDRLITSYALDDIESAAVDMAAGIAVKPVLVPTRPG